MAKQLRSPTPSSSVARLLDLTAAARAVAPSEPAPEPAADSFAAAPPPLTQSPAKTPAPRHHARAAGETPNVKRELVLTHRTDQALTDLIELYRRNTGAKLTASHVARALLSAVSHAMDHITREARHLGPLKLPSNARDCQGEREKFEARITDSLLAGLRSAPAPEWE